MDDLKIKKEIQEQVNFKLNEILTNIENRININWKIAFEHGDQKHAHYYEAFKELKKIFVKEMEMPIPYDNMFEIAQKQKRDKAVKQLSDIIGIGTRDYHYKTKKIVGIVEQLLEL